MSEEEKKAIEDFKKIIKQIEIVNSCGLSTNDFSEEIKTYNAILNLIQSQQEEIECLKRAGEATEALYKMQLEKKDEIIDLMLEEIAFNYAINSIVDIATIKRQLKEIFEKKVEV